MSRKWLIALCLVVPLALLLLAACVPNVRNNNLPGFGHVRVARMSLMRSFFRDAATTVSYERIDGQTGRVALWQDVFDGPVLLFSARETNVLLCLYDFDVGYRLFRINTVKAFEPPSKNDQIDHILFTSTCQIENANQDDWRELQNYLNSVSSVDFARQSIPLYMRVQATPRSIILRLKAEGIK